MPSFHHSIFILLSLIDNKSTQFLWRARNDKQAYKQELWYLDRVSSTWGLCIIIAQIEELSKFQSFMGEPKQDKTTTLLKKLILRMIIKPLILKYVIELLTLLVFTRKLDMTKKYKFQIFGTYLNQVFSFSYLKISSNINRQCYRPGLCYTGSVKTLFDCIQGFWDLTF